MKAALALILIYVGTFLVAIQGNSTSPVQAAAQPSVAKQAPASVAAHIDPAKESDIRFLLELTGAHNQIQEAIANAKAEYGSALSESKFADNGGQKFTKAVVASSQQKFDGDAVNEQLVLTYDKYYTDEEIKGLLQFYASPLGQKAAGADLKISREIQEATRLMMEKTLKDAPQDTKVASAAVAQKPKTVETPEHRDTQATLPLKLKNTTPVQSAQQQDQP
jgi:hypothetical protein